PRGPDPGGRHYLVREGPRPTSRRGAPRTPTRALRLLPLDRAADGVLLLARRRAAGQERVERRGELAALHLSGLLPLVVDAAVVRQLPRGVEGVDVGRAPRSERARDGLRVVDEVREAVLLVPPALEEPLGAVVGVVRRVVRADADELHAARPVLTFERDDP